MPFRNIKHIFFDLDHTLWDFEKNSKETLIEIVDRIATKYKLKFTGAEFHSIYRGINEKYWALYRNNKISKAELRIGRFRDTLIEFDVDNVKLAEFLTEEYISLSPLKTNLFPHTIEVLEYLNSKYQLHLITNGFDEVQFIKIKASKLDVYFNKIITSETVGVKKPDPLIFNYSLDIANATAHESLMIGDNYEADIFGALNVKMRAIYFNFNGENDHYENVKEIASLEELLKLL